MARVRVFEGSAYHIRWSAVFGGTVVAIGVMMLLHLLGLAAGLTAASAEGGALRGIGIGVGVWSIIVPILSLFAGAFVASRFAGPVHRGVGIWHGGVVWGLTSLGAVMLVSMVVGPAVRAGASAAGSAVSAAQDTLSGASIDQAIGPINDRLRSQGMATVTAAEIRSAAQDAISTSVQSGKMDQSTLVQALTRNTRLSRADATTLANDLEGQMRSLYTQAVDKGATAAKVASGLMWGLFFSSLLSLGSSILGSYLGVSREQRFEAEHLAATEEAFDQGVPTVRPTGPQPPRIPTDPGRH
jgi:hypothetical protein